MSHVRGGQNGTVLDKAGIYFIILYLILSILLIHLFLTLCVFEVYVYRVFGFIYSLFLALSVSFSVYVNRVCYFIPIFNSVLSEYLSHIVIDLFTFFLF